MARIFRFVILLGMLFSAGCSSLEPFLASLTPTAPVPTKQATATQRPIPTATASAAPKAPVLHVWLPPEFDPAGDNDAAKLLRQRLGEFASQNPGLTLDVRVKKMDAENDIINVLSVTGAAAPGALPDLILLSRPNLETAALKGLLHPFEGLSTALEDPNWYGYAQQLARIQNTGYGLPFAGNVLVMVYYPELGKLVTWEDVLKTKGRLVFPAGNPDGLVGLSLYGSAGGQILDAQGSPTLDEKTLARVLTLVQEGVSKEVFSPSLANISNEGQTLQIYRTGSANKEIVWILNYRPTEDGAVTPLPGVGETSFAFATGWVWALAGSNPENQQLAVKMAEYLVQDKFMGEWTKATGYLPTRPSVVGESDRTTAAILESAHLMPSNNVLAVLGPLMQEALTRVLNGEDPQAVAASVVQKLK